MTSRVQLACSSFSEPNATTDMLRPKHFNLELDVWNLYRANAQHGTQKPETLWSCAVPNELALAFTRFETDSNLELK